MKKLILTLSFFYSLTSFSGVCSLEFENETKATKIVDNIKVVVGVSPWAFNNINIKHTGVSAKECKAKATDLLNNGIHFDSATFKVLSVDVTYKSDSQSKEQFRLLANKDN